jgi:Xaa-Pro aminopeptidase
VKSPAELEGVRAAQHAAEAAMGAARDLLQSATPDAEGRLTAGGELLLAEHVRGALRDASAAAGANCPPDVVVSSAWSGGGHDPGTGPLPAGLPILVDVWPCHEASGCWADMARTFVVGDPPPEVAERHRLVRDALDRAKAAIRPGVQGRAVFDLVCEAFESAGHPTQRTAKEGETGGFQYALGHGVGLEVHEAPSLGLAGHETLVAGDVLAIEPGLSDARLGDVTIEDLVLVTADGCETLTRFPHVL